VRKASMGRFGVEVCRGDTAAGADLIGSPRNRGVLEAAVPRVQEPCVEHTLVPMTPRTSTGQAAVSIDVEAAMPRRTEEGAADRPTASVTREV